MSTRSSSIQALLAKPDAPPVVRLQMPYEQDRLQRYWTCAQLAQAWGCSYQAARCWVLANLGNAVVLELMSTSGICKYKLAVPAGIVRTFRPPGGPGNPCFFDSDFQSSMVSRRWKQKYLAAYEARKDHPI